MKKSRPSASSKRKASSGKSSARGKHTQLGRKRKVQRRDENKIELLNVPPWPPSLPYEVLVQIFQYAAYPLWTLDKYWRPTGSINWLLRTARVCKNFAEPALAALYYSPPLEPASRAHDFLDFLKKRGTLSIDYNVKIKHLDIEALSVLTHKCNGQKPLDLLELISLCPQLQGCHLYLNGDNPRHLRDMINRGNSPVYTAELFDGIVSQNINLKYFRWSWRLKQKSTHYPFVSIQQWHEHPAFRNLTSVELAHFSCVGSWNFRGAGQSSRQPRNGYMEAPAELWEALAMLPNLQDLTLFNTDAPNEDEMKKPLPALKSLTYLDCEQLSVDFLTPVLKIQGRTLEELALKHNRSLSLGFLDDLADTCPSLKQLHFDNTLYGSTADGNYDRLLPREISPTWPATLESLELLGLHQWDIADGERLFRTLTDRGSGTGGGGSSGSRSLPHLRTLRIIASFNDGWRERIPFRDRWVERFDRAFRRVSRPPRSVREAARGERDGAEADAPQRAGGRPRRALPTRELPMAARREEGADGRPLADQGLCEVVDVRIDGLRPMQDQYKESDFMDREPSSDSTWDGDDPASD